MSEPIPKVMLVSAAIHLAGAMLCVVLLRTSAPQLVGVHPALKPLKFAVSIAAFLFTMGLVVQAISVTEGARSALAWLFSSTMLLEMAAIGAQALRGRPSHFNRASPLDAALWQTMMLAILAATAGMVVIAIIATFRPLRAPSGAALPPLLAVAWRAGLWLLLLSPVSGFAMGGRGQHSIGGADGGPGLPFFNWSVLFGDLRVAHFFSLHALQLLPLAAWLLLRTEWTALVRGSLLGLLIGGTALVCVGTLAQAMAGRPVVLRPVLSPGPPTEDPSGRG